MRAQAPRNGTSYQSAFMRRRSTSESEHHASAGELARSIAALACSSGVRMKALAIAVPMRTREVACATAPSAT